MHASFSGHPCERAGRLIGAAALATACAGQHTPAAPPERPTAARPAEVAVAREVVAEPAPPARVETLAELSALDLRTRFGKYQATSAIWVPDQPMLLNRDFDFQAALTGAVMAPEAAAAKRSSDNRALAGRLAAIPAISPTVLGGRLLSRCGSSSETLSGAKSLRIYGFLFGDRSARLRVVLELERQAGPTQYVSVSNPQASHAFVAGSQLHQEFDRGLARICDLLEMEQAQARRDSLLCMVGDNESVRGNLVAEAGDQVVLALEHDSMSSLLTCPSEGVRRPRPPPGPPPGVPSATPADAPASAR